MTQCQSVRDQSEGQGHLHRSLTEVTHPCQNRSSLWRSPDVLFANVYHAIYTSLLFHCKSLSLYYTLYLHVYKLIDQELILGLLWMGVWGGKRVETDVKMSL